MRARVKGTSVQATLQKSVEFNGVGLHTGEACRAVVRPASADSGIVFCRADRRPEIGGDKDAFLIAAAPENVICASHGTALGNAHDVTVATVEHLMAAFALCSIDNAFIEVFGPEIPIFDGSSAVFVDMFRDTGIKTQNAPRREIVIDKPIRVEDGERYLEITPADCFSIDISIAFEDCLIGRQSLSLHFDDGLDQDRVARSRTFCRLHEVENLRRAGLIRGGSLENSLVVDGGSLVDGQVLREPNEFVLHKALDLIGDLYLLGGPIRGAVRTEKPGHDLNVKAAKAILRRRNMLNLTAVDTQAAAV